MFPRKLFYVTTILRKNIIKVIFEMEASNMFLHQNKKETYQ